MKMKINELEKALGISKANIRYYESEGFIFPKRNENGYRAYSNSDVEMLKKIIVYRKLGISINNIKSVIDKEKTLSDVVASSINEMKRNIETLKIAIEICEEIQNKAIDNSNFDTDYYWNEINNREANGEEFIPVESVDIIPFSTRLKNKLTYMLKLALCILCFFVFIYLFIFVGGYQLFESGDPILQELGVSVLIGVIIMFVIELFKSNSKRIENLEKRIEKLEKR